MLFAQNYSEKANLKGYFEVQKLNSYKYERFRYFFLIFISNNNAFCVHKNSSGTKEKKSLIR